MIPSLRTMATTYVVNNFQLFEKHPLLSRAPEELREDLMKKLLENPDYKPSESAPFLSVKRIDLHAIPKKHQMEKIAWVFTQCKPFVQELILPGDYLSPFKDPDKITYSEIKNPLDTIRFFFPFALPYLRAIPFVTEIIPPVDSCPTTTSQFTSLKVLRLKGVRDSGEVIDEKHLTSDGLYNLAKICPEVEELYLEDCVEVKRIPDGFSHLKSLSVINKTPRFMRPSENVHAFINWRAAHISNTTLDLLAKSSPALERLYLHNCSDTDVAPGTKFPRLKSFIREKCVSFTQRELWSANPALEVLGLDECYLTDIPVVGSGVKFLEYASSYTSLEMFLKPCPNLQVLVLTTFGLSVSPELVSSLPPGFLLVLIHKVTSLPTHVKTCVLRVVGDGEGRRAGITYLKQIEQGVLNQLYEHLGHEHKISCIIGEDGGLEEIKIVDETPSVE